MAAIVISILIILWIPAAIISLGYISPVKFPRFLAQFKLLAFFRRQRYHLFISRIRLVFLIYLFRLRELLKRLKTKIPFVHAKPTKPTSRLESFKLFNRFRLPVLRKSNSPLKPEPEKTDNSNDLQCRVQLIQQKKNDSATETFSIEIKGTIHAPEDMHYITLKASITDITDGPDKPAEIRTSIKKWLLPDTKLFCYTADLGKLPNQNTIISDWMSVGKIISDWITLPRKGKRKLKFTIAILSRANHEELGSAACDFTYENSQLGYLDILQNTRRTNCLAVAMAFAVSAADKKLYNCEVKIIKDWAKNNIESANDLAKARKKLNKALNKTLKFFRQGNQLDTREICAEILETAPLAQRYDILELCLRVAQAKGFAAPEELDLLNKLANWLDADMERFREMTEKFLPAAVHQIDNLDTILGVTCEMSKEQTRKHLNSQYRKWHARITNFDSDVKTQADHMLNLIAQARNQHIG